MVRTRIARDGPVPWSVVVDAALYGPGGLYTGDRGAGRGRDFLTSPELGPLFGAVVARYLDDAWERLGRPDPFDVVEAGAGSGALAGAVVHARPACGAALRYTAVEVSPVLRAGAAARLGPSVTVTAELAVSRVTGVVLANELLDNLAFDVYARGVTGWREVRVGLAEGAPAQGALVEVEVAARPSVERTLSTLAAEAPAGARVPWQVGGARWLRRALAVLERGEVTVVDYARSTAEMAAVGPAGWLRTYRRGGRGAPPLQTLGAQDITADVAADQLALVRPPVRIEAQGAWLDRHGMAQLEVAAAATWRERAAIGDLVALRARSRAGEAAALRDPAGLGAFTVMTWEL